VSNLVSFAEESCFSGDTFRTVRREIVFTVVGFGNRMGVPIKEDFVADYGLWYDYDDNMLLEILSNQFPQVQWAHYIYHKLLDHKGISIVDPDNDQVVGNICVRRASSLKLSSETQGGNVIYWNQVQQWKEERDVRRQDTTDS
jgi:hypothetical protein